MNSYTDPAIRITLLPRDTNPQGTIFGGIILSYIDMAGAIEAHRHTACRASSRSRCAKSSSTNPSSSATSSASTPNLRIGTTSITVRVIVEAERHGGLARARPRHRGRSRLCRRGREPEKDER